MACNKSLPSHSQGHKPLFDPWRSIYFSFNIPLPRFQNYWRVYQSLSEVTWFWLESDSSHEHGTWLQLSFFVWTWGLIVSVQSTTFVLWLSLSFVLLFFFLLRCKQLYYSLVVFLFPLKASRLLAVSGTWLRTPALIYHKTKAIFSLPGSVTTPALLTSFHPPPFHALRLRQCVCPDMSNVLLPL